MILEETLEKIKKPSQEAMERCRQHWDSIAKPLHSLGKLEDALVRIAGMTGNERIHLDKKALVVMCADNGVVEESHCPGRKRQRLFQKICCLASNFQHYVPIDRSGYLPGRYRDRKRHFSSK